jgi:hypothetical protein
MAGEHRRRDRDGDNAKDQTIVKGIERLKAKQRLKVLAFLHISLKGSACTQ